MNILEVYNLGRSLNNLVKKYKKKYGYNPKHGRNPILYMILLTVCDKYCFVPPNHFSWFCPWLLK